ncbi:MAG: hypothetical protein RSD77_10395 [Romboutsia sp.]
MNQITIENADKVKYILLNNYLEDKSIELEYKYIKAKINIDGVTESENSPIFQNMQGAYFVNDKMRLEDNRLCIEIKNKRHILYMNIGDWGYEYRIPNMHIVLGSSYNFGSSKDYFSQIEISQALEDREYVYIVKNIVD